MKAKHSSLTRCPKFGEYYNDSTTIVVPGGKTLKIESINGNFVVDNYGTTGLDNFADLQAPFVLISIDDVGLRVLSSIAHTQSFSLPYWLPAGSYKLKVYGNANYNPATNPSKVKVAISALEFNIIP